MSPVSPELTPEIVLHGYRLGMFPMAEPGGDVYWYSPDPRCILEFDRFHVSHSLRAVIRQQKFEIRVDSAFDAVIAACAARDEGTWISPDIAAVYGELHRQGFGHSVEAWYEGELAGGLYGIALGGAFFGESMFFYVRDASKVALAALMDRLQSRGFTLVDTQWNTPHLARLGAMEIPREEYLRRLEAALQLDCVFT